MHFSSLITLGALAAAPLASAATGYATVINKCATTSYLWSVGAEVSPQKTLAPNTGHYTEPYRRDPTTGGIALKITRTANGLFIPGTPQTILAYTLDPNRLWYDLSDVFGDAFSGNRLAVTTNNAQCGSIIWGNGVPPGGSQTKSCGSTSTNITLTLC